MKVKLMEPVDMDCFPHNLRYLFTFRDREIDTMDLKELNKYLGHTKPLILPMVIENVREELKKEMQAQEGPVVTL
jgi:integrase